MKAKIFLAIALIISVLVNAQERNITGKVTDETGQALPGVNISIKGKTKGTSCDLNGKYSIQVQSKDILIFSFVGYVSQEIKIGKGDILNVKMKGSVHELDEVVMSNRSILQGKSAGVSVSKSEAKIRGRTHGINSPSATYGGNYQPLPVPKYGASDVESNTEEYKSEKEIGFKATDKDPQTTFSIDVDRAAYTNIRRFIMQNGQLPPKDAV